MYSTTPAAKSGGGPRISSIQLFLLPQTTDGAAVVRYSWTHTTTFTRLTAHPIPSITLTVTKQPGFRSAYLTREVRFQQLPL